MKRAHRLASAARGATTALFLAALAAAAAAEVRYQVIDLGVTLFQSVDRPNPALASNGLIGGTNTFPASRAYLWNDGAVQFIDPPNTGFPSATVGYDVNAAGAVTGLAAWPGNVPRPFVWQGGTLSLLPDLVPGAPSVNARVAYGINDAGTVVGEWERRAFVYANGAIAALAPPLNLRGETAGPSGAFEINEQGWAVGYATYPGSFSAVVWRPDGSAFDIGTLPLASGWRPDAVARDINEANEVVGASATTLSSGFTVRHAFLWQAGSFTDLGTLRGPEWGSDARALNDRGQVVGVSEGRAFLWTAGEGIRSLNDFVDPAAGWVLVDATGINDRGWIVGNGVKDGVNRDFLLLPLVPVPEPGPALMLAAGLAALVLRRRRGRTGRPA
jgi:probable HAF family extracellular repeat protein